MKIVINSGFGGFGLSDAAKKDLNVEDVYGLSRTDSALIALLEEKGTDYCSDSSAWLSIVEIPDAEKFWHISQCGGHEHIVASESKMNRYS